MGDGGPAQEPQKSSWLYEAPDEWMMLSVNGVSIGIMLSIYLFWQRTNIGFTYLNCYVVIVTFPIRVSGLSILPGTEISLVQRKQTDRTLHNAYCLVVIEKISREQYYFL